MPSLNLLQVAQMKTHSEDEKNIQETRTGGNTPSCKDSQALAPSSPALRSSSNIAKTKHIQNGAAEQGRETTHRRHVQGHEGRPPAQVKDVESGAALHQAILAVALAFAFAFAGTAIAA